MRRIEIYDKTRRSPASSPSRGVGRRREPIERIADRMGGRVLRDGEEAVMEIVMPVSENTTHGTVDLCGLDVLEKRHLEVLFPDVERLEDIEPGRFLFFDVETTGLSQGAGTRFFLIGLLESMEGEMRFVQYFLPNLGSEPLFLRIIAQRFGRRRILVSYNGKCFDYNVMRNRFVMNGLEMEAENAAPLHLDLLYSSRRLWKGFCPDFTLSTVERLVLEYRRRRDIPGELIPDVYFRYLGGSDESGELESVLEHNRDDVFSLFALLIRGVRAVGDGCEGEKERIRGVNAVSLADMLFRIGRTTEAKRVLLVRAEEAEAAVRLGLLCKRERSFEEALQHFGTLLRGAGPVSRYVFACTEMAKIYEHAVGDFETALSYAERARDRLRRRGVLYPENGRQGAGVETMHEVERRITRLLGKCERRKERGV
ncbi:MAG: ribonuclease H-like domain-containing protein [Spirochaetes bacterium]|nr:ribonuclease H-like domain-containing protein [Spirochaetota bacterium]